MCWIRCRRQPQAKGQMERGDETATSWPCMLLLYLWCNLAFAIRQRRRRPTSTANTTKRENKYTRVRQSSAGSIIWGQVAAEGLKGPIEVPRLKRSIVHQQPRAYKSKRRRTFLSWMYRNYFHWCYLGGRFQAYFILLPRYLSSCCGWECCKFAGGFLQLP